MGVFFSISFTFYGILYNMWNTWVSPSISHRWENAVKSIELGEPRKLVPNFSLTYGYFSSLRFKFYGILCYQMGNAWFFPSKSTQLALWLFFHSIIFLLVPKSIDSLKEKTEKTDKVNSFFKKRKANSRRAGIQSKIYQKKKREWM